MIDTPPPSWYTPEDDPVCPECGNDFDGLLCDCGYEPYPVDAWDIAYERARQRDPNSADWD